MIRSGWWLALLAVALGGLTLRLANIADRPVHTDEAVHAVKFQQLWETGTYRYDPGDYHGPTHYYVAAALRLLRGETTFAALSITTLRLVPIAFSVGLIALLLPLLPVLGRTGVLAAAVLLSVSPAFVYYGSYFIQETTFVWFTLLAIVGGWWTVRTHRSSWALLAGIGVGGMIAGKETAALSALAAAVATGGVLWLRRAQLTATRARLKTAVKLLVIGSGSAVVLAAAALTAGFQNPAALLDYVGGYFGHLERSRGVADWHVYPWWFYAQRTLFYQPLPGPWFSEAFLLLLALIGTLLGWRSRPGERATGSFVQWTALFTVTLLLVYTAIPYKTPWLVLSPWLGVALLAGVGVSRLWQRQAGIARRTVIVALVALGSADLARQAYALQTRFAVNVRNPYAFGQTLPNVVELANYVEQLAATQASDPPAIAVVAPDAWPLPWYLRQHPRVGYFEAPPVNPAFDIVITTPEFYDALAAQRPEHAVSGPYGVRRDLHMFVFVQPELRAAFESAQP
jgi:uncharacterized protein (TIGR03663 family)